MDIKAPFDRYHEICGVNFDIESIKQSIDIIMNSNVEYEFRTTFVPQLSANDVQNIAEMIPDAKQYILQQYRLTQEMKQYANPKLFVAAHTKEYIEQAREQAASYVMKCMIRNE